MPINNKPTNIYHQGWIFRILQSPNHTEIPPILLIHGWTGDENSMWIFSGHLQNKATLIAPRAPVPLEPSGFAWVSKNNQSYPEYKKVGLQLWQGIESIGSLMNIPLKPLRIVGFSQGAAVALTLLCLQPEKVDKVALIAGFTPADPPKEVDLRHVSCFISHGLQDKVVPISNAFETKEYLEMRGANTIFCQSDVGHKIDVKCFYNLSRFLLS